MGGADKLLIDIAGRPLLAWTLAAVAASPVVGRIVIATAAERTAELAGATWLPDIVTDVVAGGDRRQESVAAGFAALERDGSDDGRVVLVHDAARPLVSAALVASVAEATALYGAAIPVVPVAETLKRVEDGVDHWHRGTRRARGGPDAAGRSARPPSRGVPALPRRRPGDLDR